MSSSGSTYLLPRSGLANARLTFQHLGYIVRQGWYLHPSIQSSPTATRSLSEPLRIADLATGNAIWAIEASKAFAKAGVEVEITGLDISPAQFPVFFTRPSNVTLDLHDLYKPVPDKYKEYFDVIHVRLLIAAIYSSDKDILLGNILSMLKPGGHLQWEEATFPIMLVVRPDENGQLTVSNETINPVHRMFRAADFSAGCRWAATLPGVFKQHHLADIVDFRPPVVASELPNETQCLLWSLTEVMGHAVTTAPEEKKAELQQELETALKEANDIVNSGAMLAYSWITVVGKKPLSGA